MEHYRKTPDPQILIPQSLCVRESKDWATDKHTDQRRYYEGEDHTKLFPLEPKSGSKMKLLDTSVSAPASWRINRVIM